MIFLQQIKKSMFSIIFVFDFYRQCELKAGFFYGILNTPKEKG